MTQKQGQMVGRVIAESVLRYCFFPDCRKLMQIVVVLTATVAMKAFNAHYDFSWASALVPG
jgi:hypothetical protein